MNVNKPQLNSNFIKNDKPLKKQPKDGPVFRPLDEKLFEEKMDSLEKAEPKDAFSPGVSGAENGEKTAETRSGEIYKSVKKSESFQPKPKQWTVLFYGNGNCDLQDGIENSVSQLESVGSSDNINFVAQLAHGDKGGKAERIYLKKPSWLGFKKNSQVMEKLDKTNMAGAKTLKDFITWGMKTFPAEHYMVVMNGHGMGFIGSMPDDNSDDIMTTPEFKSALDAATKESGQKIDVLGFDSCLMANAETAYAAKDSAKFMAASEEVLFSGNWDYEQIASRLKEEADGDGLTTAEALEAIVKGQYNHKLLTSSIIDCRDMEGFAKRLKDFSGKLINTKAPEYGIRRAFRDAQHYCQRAVLSQADNGNVATAPMDQMRDVVAVAMSIITSDYVGDVELKKSALELAKYIKDEVVIFEVHRKGMGLSESTGMSIYAPASGADKYAKFYNERLSLAKDTGWGEVVRKFGTAQQ